MNNAGHNLDTFKILYIIKGILSLLLSFLPLLYIFLGVFLFGTGLEEHGEKGIAGLIFICVGSIIFLMLLVLGVLNLLAGKYLGEKRRYDFIFIMAIINCLTGILGMLLGIFSLIELSKPRVRDLFGKH